ncbi:MAG: hypothetical protein HQK49_14825 [Oligoflexia bacterium]|nr:hypothetical protein [Oligoflexia bacterium]
MSKLLFVFLSLMVMDSAIAISNLPLPDYRANDNCGLSIPTQCNDSGKNKDNFCDGHREFLDLISNASNVIHSESYVVWCWTLIEEWHNCEYPNPKLYGECRALASKSNSILYTQNNSSCTDVGFNAAKNKYLNDLDSRCQNQ